MQKKQKYKWIPVSQHLAFSDREIDVLIQFGVEWLHYQILPRGEIEDNIEPAIVAMDNDYAMSTKW